MRRGTTPTHTFTLPFDTSVVSSVKIIYAQADNIILTKLTDAITMSGNQIITKLTQQETLLFNCKRRVQIQVRIVTLGGDSLVSDIKRIDVDKCLEDEVFA